MTDVINIKQINSQEAPLDPAIMNSKIPAPVHRELGKPSKIFHYRSVSGDVVMQICRFETSKNGKKQKDFRPYSKIQGKWKWESIVKNRPLYNLDKLSVGPKSKVIITEGEKTADAMSLLDPGAIVTTTSGGSNACDKTDFTPLKYRDVLIIPDADQAGKKYAYAVAMRAHKAGAKSVRIMDTSLWAKTKVKSDGSIDFSCLVEHEKSWDAADAAIDGWTAQSYALLIEKYEQDLIKSNYPKHWNFIVDRDEVFQIMWKKENNNYVEIKTPVFSRVEVVGRLTNSESKAHAVLVEVKDNYGKKHQLKISMADIHGAKIHEVTSMLAVHGWKTYSENVGSALRAFLQHHPNDEHIHLITKTGWQDETKFATPCWHVGRQDLSFFDSDAEHHKLFASKGAHCEWQTNLGNFGASQLDLTFVLSLAFSGPLLPIFGRDGFGVHFFGPSSCGKSTLLRAGASVWGPSKQQVKTWNLTTTALEATTACLTSAPLEQSF